MSTIPNGPCDEQKCECKMEQEFDFVVIAGEKEECVQRNHNLMTKEFERLFQWKDPGSSWRLCEANYNKQLCTTYPQLLICHTDLSDEVLTLDASFRKRGRFPTPVWYCKETGASLIRGSQPDTITGLYRGSGSQTDEQNLESLFSTCKKSPIIIDCRPQTNALVNLFNHGGTESLLYKYEVKFMNIPNVQGVTHGLKVLIEQYSKEIWNQNMECVIQAAVNASENIMKGRSVFVHCSDGWDRTTQVISLAQIMLDPYYRTLEGFYVLIEKEWVNFSHMFSIRTENGRIESSDVEWSPIFAQWLNILWWFVCTSPTALQFNERLLEKLLANTYNPKLYSGSAIPNLWYGTNAPVSWDGFVNIKYDSNTLLEWNCPSAKEIWEPLYFKLSQCHIERTVKQRLTPIKNSFEGIFSNILSRFVKDTVHLLQDEKEESQTNLPPSFAACVTFLVEGKKIRR